MNKSALQPYFLLLLIVGAATLAYFILAPFIAPLVLGIVFAVVLQPLYQMILRRFKGRESLASLATVLITVVVILVPLSLVSMQLLREAQQLYTSFSGGEAERAVSSLISQTTPVIERVIPGASDMLANLSNELDTYAEQALTWIIQNLGSAFSSVAAVVLDLFIFFVTLYYLLRDGGRLRKHIIDLSPLANTDDDTIFTQLGLAVNSVVKGMLAVGLVQGILSGIGFLIFGVPNAVLWGLVASVAAFVPLLGTSVVLIPAVLFLALTGNMGAAIGLGIWGLVAVGLVDNFLGPRLMSAGMRLHPLLVLLSVLGGIALFGPVGIFLGPLTVSFLLALLSLHSLLTQKHSTQ